MSQKRVHLPPKFPPGNPIGCDEVGSLPTEIFEDGAGKADQRPSLSSEGGGDEKTGRGLSDE